MATVTDPDVTEPNVTTVLQEIMLQLQLITKQLSGMQRPESGNARDDNFERVDTSLQEKEEAWETVVDTLKEREQRTTDSWKDELNNILIFSGLFSAIATAFTIVSITWLQQDPGDATNIFLAHFSLQFSNLVVTSNNINSSTPALPLQNVTSSFVSASYAEPVNVLWVLSLTFSLIAAFFAITVQQWLRQLQIPTGVSLQQAASLISLRYDGLIMWQVPGIIALLPLLLQIAVVLFLVGLFLLFLALNHTVAIVFGAVAITALTIFLIMTVILLVFIRCPYKSPLIPTLILVIQGLVFLTLGILMIVLPFLGFFLLPLDIAAVLIVLFTLFIIFITRLYIFHRRINFNKERERLQNLFYRFEQKFSPFVIWFITYVFVINIGDFWVLRECRHFSKLDTDEISRFDAASLIDVMLLIPSSSFAKVARCLHTIKTSWASTVFLKALQRGITGIDPKSKGEFLFSGMEWQLPSAGELRVWDVRKVPSVTKWFTVRHLRLGWIVLQKHLDRTPSKESSGALIMLNDLTNVMKPQELDLSITKPILQVCAHQDAELEGWMETEYGGYPAWLLLHVLQEDDAVSTIDIEDAIALMTKCRDLNKCRDANEILHLSYNSCALALMVSQPHVFDAAGKEVVQSLADLLGNANTLDTLASKLAEQYRRPESVNSYMAVPPMILSLCRSLAQLANVRTDAVLRNPLDSHAARLAGILREVADKLHEDDKTVAIGHLDWFEGIRACRAAELSRLAHALVGSFPNADIPVVVVTAEDEHGCSFDDVIQIAPSNALVQFFPFVTALPPRTTLGNNIGTSTGSFLAPPTLDAPHSSRVITYAAT
ncbi:hypothetical protein NM688_g6582 [Phlebia brevispora]|uniref:Uncharacterized protein n=1 Tax=Phlebia brevispora TaxID=194682 RepID=A0ACC1SED6_9APHY|nr:hypothetical protein NM688_g6582 [Phlebia brevispora]